MMMIVVVGGGIDDDSNDLDSLSLVQAQYQAQLMMLYIQVNSIRPPLIITTTNSAFDRMHHPIPNNKDSYLTERETSGKEPH
jgi:hypothetical protein